MVRDCLSTNCENNSDNNEMKKLKLKPNVYQSILEKAILSKLNFPPAASFGSDMQTKFIDDGIEIVLTMEQAVWKEVYRNYDLAFFEGETRRFIISNTPMEKGHEFFFLYKYRKTCGTTVDFHIYIEKVNSNLSSIFDIKLSPELAIYRRDYHKGLWELTGFILQRVDTFDYSAETSSLFFRKYEYDTFSEAVSAFLLSLGKSQEVLKEAEHLLALTQAETFCGRNLEDLLQEHSVTKIIPTNFNEKTSTFQINFLNQDSVYFIIYQSKEGKFWLFLHQGEKKKLPYVTWSEYHEENKEAFVAEVLSPYWKENKKKRKRVVEDEEYDDVNRKLDFSPRQKLSNIPDTSPDKTEDSPDKTEDSPDKTEDSPDTFQTPEKCKTDEGDYSNTDMLVDQPN